jgi:hypothetical protein
MITEYALIKFLHILIAILALGTSAGLGIVLEFYGDHPTYGAFVLGAIKRIVAFFVVPGYVLMLATGLWMTHLSWPMTTKWIQFVPSRRRGVVLEHETASARSKRYINPEATDQTAADGVPSDAPSEKSKWHV